MLNNFATNFGGCSACAQRPKVGDERPAAIGDLDARVLAQVFSHLADENLGDFVSLARVNKQWRGVLYANPELAAPGLARQGRSARCPPSWDTPVKPVPKPMPDDVGALEQLGSTLARALAPLPDGLRQDAVQLHSGVLRSVRTLRLTGAQSGEGLAALLEAMPGLRELTTGVIAGRRFIAPASLIPVGRPSAVLDSLSVRLGRGSDGFFPNMRSFLSSLMSLTISELCRQRNGASIFVRTIDFAALPQLAQLRLDLIIDRPSWTSLLAAPRLRALEWEGVVVGADGVPMAGASLPLSHARWRSELTWLRVGRDMLRWLPNALGSPPRPRQLSIAQLETLCQLRTLEVDMDGHRGADLSRLRSLRELHLTEVDDLPGTMMTLAKLPALTALHVRLGGRHIPWLREIGPTAELAALTSLSLEDDVLHHRALDLSDLAGRVPGLARLRLSGFYGLTGTTALARLGSLTKLTLLACDVNAATLAEVARATTLTDLWVDCVMHSGPPPGALVALSPLRHLARLIYEIREDLDRDDLATLAALSGLRDVVVHPRHLDGNRGVPNARAELEARRPDMRLPPPLPGIPSRTMPAVTG